MSERSEYAAVPHDDNRRQNMNPKCQFIAQSSLLLEPLTTAILQLQFLYHLKLTQ